MSHHQLRYTLTASLLLALTAAGASPGAELPGQAWKFGDLWRCKATLYPAEGPPVPFDLLVYFGGVEQPNGVPCWRIHFNPGKGAPAGSSNYQVVLVQADGWPRYALRLNDLKEEPLDPVKGPLLLLDPPPAIPLEIFPLADMPPRQMPGTDATLTVTRRPGEAGTFVLEATVKKGDREVLRVRQVWADGAKWWTEYERYRDGRKELSCVQAVPAAKGNPPLADPGPPPKPDPQEQLLRGDSRLQTQLTLRLGRTPFQALLDRLSAESGVALEMDPALARARPYLPGLDAHHSPVWQLLLSTGRSSFEEARWEKHGDGYRLTASRARDPDPTVPPPTPARRGTQTVLTVLSLAAAATVTAWLLFRFWRGKRKGTAHA